MRTRRLIPLLLAGSLALAACGGSSDESSESPDSTESPATEAPMASDAPMTTDATDTTVEVAPREERATLAPAALSAGPITVTASVCSIDGIETGDGSAEIDDFDVIATHFFVPVDNGVAALTYSPGASCAMTLVTSVGEAGILTTEDTPDGVAASSTGRVATSTVFGSKIFDITNGQSYECSEPSGDVDIKDDGSEILVTWPSSPIERYSLSDTTCTFMSELAIPADFVESKYVAFDGSDLFLGAADTAGTTFASRVSNDVVQWKVGNAETSGQGWIGWVHGMARCGAGYCVIDTNTDKLIVLDAGGAVRAEFSVSELIGERLFYHQMRPAADGSVYVLATDSLDDGMGGRYLAIEIFRVEVTG